MIVIRGLLAGEARAPSASIRFTPVESGSKIITQSVNQSIKIHLHCIGVICRERIGRCINFKVSPPCCVRTESGYSMHFWSFSDKTHFTTKSIIIRTNFYSQKANYHEKARRNFICLSVGLHHTQHSYDFCPDFLSSTGFEPPQRLQCTLFAPSAAEYS